MNQNKKLTMENKVYYITETQFANLLQKKKIEKETLTNLVEELLTCKKTLNEGVALEEGIVDTLKSYVSKGLVTTALVASLLASNHVNAQQLQQAGVPQDQIELATSGGGEQNSSIPLNKIEDRLLHAMKRAGLDGSIASYQKLNPQQKEKILTGIRSKITTLSDVDKYNHVSIGGWNKTAQDNPSMIQFDQQNRVTISVDTTESIVTVPLVNTFSLNSTELQNPEATKAQIQELLNQFTVIDHITITSSSSTLRNTGSLENKTWKESSQMRAEAVVNLINGMQHDLGGCGLNQKGTVTPDVIQINANGTNGDGTSGPKSPYEASPQGAKMYQERGIDSIYWKSTATDAPLENKADYQQFQKVEIQISGRIVTTDTQDVPSYRYVQILTKDNGGTVELRGNPKKDNNIAKCPVKVKKTKAQAPQD